jgi:hypothetical protein
MRCALGPTTTQEQRRPTRSSPSRCGPCGSAERLCVGALSALRLAPSRTSLPGPPPPPTPFHPRSLQAALERYRAALGGREERLATGSDDFTLYLWEPGASKTPLARMTGHMQLVNQVRAGRDAWVS